MQSILLHCHASQQETLIAELWAHGTLGIIEELDRLRAFFDDASDLAPFAHSALEIRTEAPPDLSDFPKQDWDPIAVGERFWIAPSWIEQSTPPHRIRLAIDNPNAFGTGRHESTQLALEALEQYVTQSSTVLDIGSGSGILSHAASALGARKVFSCDIHTDAIASSQSQLRSRLFRGSADSIRTQTGDIVLANISAKVIDVLHWELNRITKLNGVLLLTGFIQDNPPANFSPEKVAQRGDWLCWLCRPRATTCVRSSPVSHSLQWW